MFDTFISEEHSWSEIKSLSDEISFERNVVTRVQKRMNRISVFLRFAEAEFLKLQSEALRRGLPAEWVGNPFAETKNTFEINIKYAVRSAERNYSRREPKGHAK